MLFSNVGLLKSVICLLFEMVKVIVGIYWEVFKIWFKGVFFVSEKVV